MTFVDQIPSISLALLVCATVVTVWLIGNLLSKAAAKGLPLPKGPPGVPLLGNITSHSSLPVWEQYSLWAKTYGPLFYLDMGGTPYIVLNSLQTATDLLNKRSKIYSDRPGDMRSHLLGLDRLLFRMRSSDKRFATMRKLIHSEVGSGVSGGMDRHSDMIERERGVLLKGLKDSPDKWTDHVVMASARPNMMLLYGYVPIYPPSSDPLINAINKVGVLAGNRNPGRWLVDSYPILRFLPRWFPGTEFLRVVAETRDLVDLCLNKPLEFTKNELVKNSAVPSMASRLISEDIAEDMTRCVTGTLFLAGAQTVIATLEVFILLMMLHPDIQKIGQEEMDLFVQKHGRLPKVEDLESGKKSDMRYCGAVMKEVVRWHPVGILGLPHRLTEEDAYDGMRIPEGSIVVSNMWQYRTTKQCIPLRQTSIQLDFWARSRKRTHYPLRLDLDVVFVQVKPLRRLLSLSL